MVVHITALISMSTTLQPLCDRDQTDMSTRIVRLVTETGMQIFEAYGCEATACTRCYSESMGYFDFIAGTAYVSERQTLCDADACPMYLESAFPGEDHVWKCPCCGQRERY